MNGTQTAPVEQAVPMAGRAIIREAGDKYDGRPATIKALYVKENEYRVRVDGAQFDSLVNGSNLEIEAPKGA